MDFVENDLIGMTDAPEPGDEGQDRRQRKREPVIALTRWTIILLRGGLGQLVELYFDGRFGRVGLFRASSPLPQASLRRLRPGHGSVLGKMVSR